MESHDSYSTSSNNQSLKENVLLYLHDFVTWLIVILLVRPVGILGKARREKV